jgi:hypothetical protein
MGYNTRYGTLSDSISSLDIGLNFGYGASTIHEHKSLCQTSVLQVKDRKDDQKGVNERAN